MDVVSLIIPGILGILLGITTGLLPGIGTASLMLILYPFLYQLTLESLFVFYLALINSTQYYGSVSAITFGLVGEISSLPAVKTGNRLFHLGLGHQALQITATASFIASLFSLLCLIMISVFMTENISLIFNGKLILYLLFLSSIIIVFTSNYKTTSLVFLILGMIVSQIGYNDLHNVRFLTFGFDALDGGLPIFPIICGLLIVPLILENWLTNTSTLSFSKVSLVSRIKSICDLKFFPSIFRGSVVGFVTGLIPGSSYTISSNVADSIERKFFSKTDEITSLTKRLVSAEAANNSGSVSVLIPLLLLALPIVVSEAVFLGVAQSKGFGNTINVDFFLDNLTWIVLTILIVNSINWILSGVFYNIILSVYNNFKKVLYPLIIFISISIMFFQALEQERIYIFSITFLISLMIGLVSKSTESKFAFIYAFFVSTLFLDEFYRQFLL
jgi:putative tricarboxylic transport membrane protein